MIRIVIISLLTSVASGLMFIRYARCWGFIDLPEDRKVHALPTPRSGGLSMALALLLASVFAGLLGWADMPHYPWQTLFAGLGFLVMGGLDDRFSFHPKNKFLAFILLSVLAAWPWVTTAHMAAFGGIHFGSWSFHPASWLLGVALTLWFMSVPNAVNIQDAINGYMGGFMLILSIAAAIRGVETWAFIGVLAGFLLLNWPKAKHFMGDAGSFGGGFLIAELVLRSGGLAHPMQALIWTAPISLDVAMGLVRRRCLGMSPFQADRSTCPHHLLVRFRGSHGKAALVLWVNTLVCVCLAGHPWLALIYILGYIVLLVYLNYSTIVASGLYRSCG